MNEMQIVAMADQINAAHRDAMDAYRRFKASLMKMDLANRRLAVSVIPPMHLELLAGLAEEDGDEWFRSHLMELGNA